MDGHPADLRARFLDRCRPHVGTQSRLRSSRAGHGPISASPG